MKKISLLLFFVVASVGCFGQKNALKLANKYFSDFEYKRAAKLFETEIENKKFTAMDYEKLMYSWYQIGDFQRCYDSWESFNKNEIDPYFRFQHAKICVLLKKCEEAQLAYADYRRYAQEFDLSGELQSCGNIQEADLPDVKSITEFEINTSKSDFYGSKTKWGQLVYQEQGYDAKKEKMPKSELDEATFFLSEVFILTDSLNPIEVDTKNPFASISHVAIHPETKEVFATINFPIAQNQEDKIPQLFKGKFDADQLLISDLKPWGFTKNNGSSGQVEFSPDGNKMIFVWDNNETQGTDFFSSKMNGESWSQPTKLEELSSTGNEMYPQFIGDSMFTFSSDRVGTLGNLDIFNATFSDNTFGEITHLSHPINGVKDDFGYKPIDDFNAIFTSNRLNGTGDDDIYSIAFVKPEPVIEVPEPEVYVAKWVDKKFYFEFDKFNINKDESIDTLITFLNQYEDFSLIVEGHTDRRGSRKYNEKLSKNRAEDVKKALVAYGIKAEQISTVGKGFKEPQVDCKQCTEEEHALNRVAILKLTSSKQ